ncbi:MAG: dienelactone hydrolase family protein [Alphaproteobacteria bacterium]|tara:strand:+ start:1831 stop:2571 length:741 start_codon:yes stop_codon:yes gene_type:complete
MSKFKKPAKLAPDLPKEEDIPHLTGPMVLPRDGSKPEQVVLLLHGVGSDGDDLINLATYFGRVLPKAVFIAPNAPFRFDGGPMGFQWFSLADPSKEKKLEGVKMAAPILNALIDHLLAELGLDESKMALIGFSQGTMMALHVGPRRVKPLAGIIGYSGALVGDELLASEIKSKPPVLLMHGEADPIVPPDLMYHAEDTLKAAGVPVAAYLSPDLGHGLDDMGIQLGMEFLAEMFGIDVLEVAGRSS